MPPLADGILGTGAVPIWMSEFLGGSGLGDLGRFEHLFIKGNLERMISISIDGELSCANHLVLSGWQ